jgi:hypothetical protein
MFKFGGLFRREDNKLTRKHAQKNQQKYQLAQSSTAQANKGEEGVQLAPGSRPTQPAPAPGSRPSPSPQNKYLAVLLFNLTAAFDEGHCVLALGSATGELQTFSYYRHSHLKIKAPGLVARLKYPMTFEQIIDESGWIYHGNDGRFWEEHFDCALALAVTAAQFDTMLDYAQSVVAAPGTYELFDNNCLDFARNALFKANIVVLNTKGVPINTMIPKDFFKEAFDAEGAEKFGEWKYWFKLTPKPQPSE